jgi:hypothetical protein
VQDPDGVEWEVYVLNHDIEDGAACATDTQHLPAMKGLTVIKSCGACCS